MTEQKQFPYKSWVCSDIDFNPSWTAGASRTFPLKAGVPAMVVGTLPLNDPNSREVKYYSNHHTYHAIVPVKHLHYATNEELEAQHDTYYRCITGWVG